MGEHGDRQRPRSSSGPATLVNTKIDADCRSTICSAAVNPFRASDPSTELKCAVVRLPLANGVARVDRTIAMETAKLGVVRSGTLDFRNETLDLAFQPKVRKGISIRRRRISPILVRVTGPFALAARPVDASRLGDGDRERSARRSAPAACRLVGQTLLSWAEGSGPGPCQVALGAPAANAPASAAKGEPADLVNEVGNAVGKLLGK